MEKNSGKISYLKLTTTGQIYLTDFLRGNIEPNELAHQIAYLLAVVKKESDPRGLSKAPGRLPGSFLLAYESALENKLIEVVKGDLFDSIEDLMGKRWNYLERQEKESAFRAGLGPSPDVFGGYGDEED